MKQVNLVLRMMMGGLLMLPLMGWSQATHCPNLNFSDGTLQYWQCYVGSWSEGNYQVQKSPQVPGRHTIMDWEALAASGQLNDEMCNKIQKVPTGYSFSARIGNAVTGAEVDAIEYELTVDSMSPLLVLSYAWVMENPEHELNEQPQFTMKITNSDGKVLPIPCGNVNFVSGDMPDLACETSFLQARNWTKFGLNLESVIGQKIKIYLETRDCTQGGHFGYAYVVAECRPMRIDLAYCAGTSVARLRAPDGFESYTWTRSDQPNWADYRQQVTIQNPNDSAIVTCVVRSELGCESELSTMILKTEIDAQFMYGVKDEYGDVPFRLHNWESWYDTCARTATFVEFVKVHNSEKQSILWEIHGLPVTGRDSMFTYTFPDLDERKEYLVRLTVTAENGCMDTSRDSYLITIFPSPKVKIEGRDQLCEGKETWLEAIAVRSEFAEHYWSWVKSDGSTGIATGDSLFINAQGTYYLKSLDVNAVDCFAYDTLVVTALKPAQNIEITHVACWGDATGEFRHGAITGGKAPLQEAKWTIWDNDNKVFKDSNMLNSVDTQVIFRNLIAGVYTFYGIDAEGCEIIDTVIIREPAEALRFSTTPKETTCFNGEIAFEVTGGVPYYYHYPFPGSYDLSYSYEISINGSVIRNGEIRPIGIVGNLPAGVYTVKVWDDNGCVISDIVSILAIEEPPMVKGTIGYSTPFRYARITILFLDDSTYIYPTTNALGEYSIIVPCNASITILPDSSGFTFSPPYRTLSNITNDFFNQDFVAIPTTGVNSLPQAERNLRVYPNPTTGNLTIECRDAVCHVSSINYTIYNVVGQVVMSNPTSPSPSKGGESSAFGDGWKVVIDISHLAKGMYYLKVLDKVVKFVKE